LITKSYIPNILTLANLIFGYLALLQDNLKMSVAFVFAAMFFDVFDGMIARALHTSGEFGKQLDSLCDMVSFGVVPGIIYTRLGHNESLSILAGLIFTCGAALRLAKFNMTESKDYFVGLATPAGTMVLLGIFLAYEANIPSITDIFKNDVVYICIPLFLSSLMLSNIKMFSLKGGFLNFKENPGPILLVIVSLIALLINIDFSLLVGSMAYIIIALALNLLKK